MTRTRHLRRSAVIATATTLFAVAGAGSAALAVGGTDIEAAPAAAVVHVTPSVFATPSENAAVTRAAAAITRADAVRLSSVTKPAAKPAVRHTAKPAAKPALKPTVRHTAKPAAKPASKPSSGGVIYIRSYVVAPGSQAAIDRCNLVLWASSPLWLAGHNYCGFQWMAYVATGRTVVVTKGPAAGRYVVTGHLRLGRQGGAMPRVNADLVLQTCVGSGTGLTLLRRV